MYHLGTSRFFRNPYRTHFLDSTHGNRRNIFIRQWERKQKEQNFAVKLWTFFPKFQKYFRKIKFKQRQARSSFDDHAQSLCSFWPAPGGSIIPTRKGFGSVSLKISFEKSIRSQKAKTYPNLGQVNPGALQRKILEFSENHLPHQNPTFPYCLLFRRAHFEWLAESRGSPVELSPWKKSVRNFSQIEPLW